MSDTNKILLVHFIHPERGLLYKFPLSFAPRVGDELRLTGDRFYTVVRLVWVYDEPESHFSRLNVEIKEAP